MRKLLPDTIKYNNNDKYAEALLTECIFGAMGEYQYFHPFKCKLTVKWKLLQCTRLFNISNSLFFGYIFLNFFLLHDICPIGFLTSLRICV